MVIKQPIGDFELGIGVLPIFIFIQSSILNPHSQILKIPIPISKSPRDSAEESAVDRSI